MTVITTHIGTSHTELPLESGDNSETGAEHAGAGRRRVA